MPALAAGAVVLAAVGAAALAGSMTVPEMTRDVAALAGVHPLACVLS